MVLTNELNLEKVRLAREAANLNRTAKLEFSFEKTPATVSRNSHGDIVIRPLRSGVNTSVTLLLHNVRTASLTDGTTVMQATSADFQVALDSAVVPIIHN